MKILKEANQLIDSLFPQIDSSRRLHAFCIFHEVNNDLLLYNGITGELIVDDEINEEFLLKHHYYVPNDFDEYSFVEDVRNILNNLKNHQDNYTILTTTDCNARCFYCYQKGIRKQYMSKETAAKIADEIPQNANICWFGGEPLLNTDVIDIICQRLTDFNSRIITNGSLFTEELIHKAIEQWHLKTVQITLDGTKDIYNKTKNYGNDYFTTVIDNIKSLINNNVKVSIRLNLNKFNYDDLFKLADYLFSVFKNNISLDIRMLYQDKDNEQLYQQKLKLQKYVHDLGLLENNLSGIIPNACIADDPWSIVINVDGKRFACEHLDEHLDKTYWKQRYHDIKCYKCKLFPQCIRPIHCPGFVNDCHYEEKILKLKWAMEDYLKNDSN